MVTINQVFFQERSMPKIVKDADIFPAVIQVITEWGYAGATTKQMADAANVSEVTLFRKYESKLQLVKQAMVAIIAQTDFDAATQFSGNVAADLLNVVQAYQDSAIKHGRLIFMMLAEMSRYPELASLLDTPFAIYTSIGNLLVKYQSEGVLQQEHPLHAVSALLGPLMYTAMMQSAIPNSDLPALDLQNHVTWFLEGRRVGKQEK
jgi:TetR/AcrR family transcriptional regulator